MPSRILYSTWGVCLQSHSCFFTSPVPVEGRVHGGKPLPAPIPPQRVYFKYSLGCHFFPTLSETQFSSNKVPREDALVHLIILTWWQVWILFLNSYQKSTMNDINTKSCFKGLIYYLQFYNSIWAPGTELLAAPVLFVLTLPQLNKPAN